MAQNSKHDTSRHNGLLLKTLYGAFTVMLAIALLWTGAPIPFLGQLLAANLRLLL